MPNTTVRAAAERMPAINRRNFLANTAAASGAIGALAMPQVAHATQYPDTELLRMGEELGRADQAYQALWYANEVRFDAQDEVDPL